MFDLTCNHLENGFGLWEVRLEIKIIKYYKVVKLKELWGHGYRGTTFNFKAAVSILIKMLEVTQLVHRA
jgi:hypothetical protein